MRRILKWEVPALGAMEFTTADDPAWLGVGWQEARDGLHLVAWCEATLPDDAHPARRRTRLVAAPTGAEVPEAAVHVGSVQTLIGADPMVMHVYARTQL